MQAATQSSQPGQEPVAHELHVWLAPQASAFPGVHFRAHLPVAKMQTSDASQSSAEAHFAWHAGRKKRDATKANAKSERARTIGGG